MPNPTIVPITQPRVPFLNPETGFVSMPWYLFLLSLSQSQGGSTLSLDDLQKGPPTLTIDEINAIIDRLSGNANPSQDGLLAQIAELQKQVNNLEQQPSSLESQIAELQKQVDALAVLPAQTTAMLSQLADVSAMDPSDGDKLIYNGTTGKWEQDSRSYLMIE
jgi:TolA-binding protein